MSAIGTQQAPLVEPSEAEENALRFMARRLRQIGLGWAEKRLEDSELVAEGPDGKFWELIGLRVKGHAGVILGAALFRRQDGDSEYPRQSLPSYLAQDCSLSKIGARSQRALVAMEVPVAMESVPEFLRQLTGLRERHPVLVDTAIIQLAFDLRVKNPSLEKPTRAAESSRQTVILRTRGGHVLSGDLLDIHRKLHRDLPFVALIMGIQHTAHGSKPLPTLFIHRRCISMLSKISAVSQLEERMRCTPFRLENANPLDLILEG